jgi:predicted dehydrogenase
MVKVALVGTGFIGEIHAKSYENIQNANLAAVISTTPEKGRQFAEKFGASYYPNLQELLKKEEVDCVDICTPTYVHADMAVEAAEAGLHVLCEKPIAITLKEADRIIEAVAKGTVKAMAGHTMRFWPEYRKAKEIIESGELGEPLHAHCERLAATPDWHKNRWGLNEKQGGGASVDLHIHDLDYLIWLFGKPKFVSAVGVPDDSLGGISHITTNIDFENGKSGFAEGGWAFSSSFPFTMILRILCERGTVEWIFRAGKNIENRSQKMNLIVYKNDGSIDEPEVPEDDAYYLECKYFIDCIDNDREITNATLQDGRNALALALAATKSAKENRAIKI